jgi:hypothetical protein
MRKEFKVGDHVEWNSEGDHVRGNDQEKDHLDQQV